MSNLIPSFIIDKCQNDLFSGTFDASTMFIDISGFTPMTQELMKNGKEGAEILNDILTEVFTPVIDIVYEYGGFISSFEGDAFTAIFSPASPKQGKSHSVYAAEKIISLFKKLGHQETKFGAFSLTVKIGLSNGEVEWGIVGSDEHSTWYFRGEGIDGAVRAEKRCGKNEIFTDDFLRSSASPKPGIEYRLPGLDPGSSGGNEKLDSIREATPHLFPPSVEGGRSKFFPESVLNFTGKGEFRDVCCAFVSFKELSNETELSTFAAKLLTETYNFGGYFEGLNFGDKGGNCLVIFGAPTAYENNIERAVDFVNAIRSDYPDIRAGVTFGTVFAGLKGSKRRTIYGVIGDVVNLSARFMMKADWGEVWLDKSVQNHIKTLYKTKANKPISFKGFHGFMVNYALQEKQEKRVSFFAGDLVGRKRELIRLSRFLRPIRNGKFGVIVTVYGEPGVGKSRLIYELMRKEGIRTFTMQCDSILKKSLNPFAYFLNEYFIQSNVTRLLGSRESGVDAKAPGSENQGYGSIEDRKAYSRTITLP